MAIFTGLLKNFKGSAGQLTFKKVGSQTVVSEKVTTVKNKRTTAQQRQRMKWNNVLHFYQGILPLLKNAFEKKGSNVSDYNCFVRLNNTISPVYLTKAQSEGGACVAAPYQITQGSIPSIVISGTGAAAKTDIALGSLAIDANTTIADFSKAVVENNADYNYNDQISFYNVLQLVNAETNIPYCRFYASYVILDKDSTVKLWDQVNKAGFAAVGGYLAHGDSEGDGVFAWVHSVKENGKTKVSTQFLIDNNTKLANYISDDAYTLAANSYGTSSDAFLDPAAESESDSTTTVADTTDSDSDDDSDSGSSTQSGGSSSQDSGSSTQSGGSSTQDSSTTETKRISVTADPTEGGTVTGAGSYAVGTEVTLTATPADGYTFDGWNNGSSEATQTITVTKDANYIANFTANA